MRSRRLGAAALVVGLLFAASAARADAPAAPDYTKEPATTQYPAPLYQQTQPSYVPQSVAMSGPRQIKDWQDGDPIPPGYRPVERTRTGLLVGGGVTFGVLYFFSALAASASANANKGQTNPAAALL